MMTFYGNEVEVGDLWETYWNQNPQWSVRFLVLEIVEDKLGPIAFIQVLGDRTGFYSSRETFERFDSVKRTYNLLARV